MVTHHHTKFFWDRSSQSLSADISDLAEGGERAVFHQAYDDACDMGFVIAGKHHDVRFVVYSHDTNEDGDVTVWELTPQTPLDARRAGACKHVLVWND